MPQDLSPRQTLPKKILKNISVNLTAIICVCSEVNKVCLFIRLGPESITSNVWHLNFLLNRLDLNFMQTLNNQ